MAGENINSFYRKLKELGEDNQSDYVSDPYNEREMLQDASTGTSFSPQDISNIYNAESASGTQLKNKPDREGNYSGASGHFQFIPGTEEDIINRILPKGTEIPTNPLRKQALLMQAYTKYNEDRLKKFGLPITKENIYALHHEGTSGGLKAIKNQNSPEGKKLWQKIMAQLAKSGTRQVDSIPSNQQKDTLDVLNYPENYIEN